MLHIFNAQVYVDLKYIVNKIYNIWSDFGKKKLHNKNVKSSSILDTLKFWHNVPMAISWMVVSEKLQVLR